MTTTTLAGKNPVYNGSYLMKLHGGSDAVHKGYIYQKDSKPITVDNYSGHTLVSMTILETVLPLKITAPVISESRQRKKDLPSRCAQVQAESIRPIKRRREKR